MTDREHHIALTVSAPVAVPEDEVVRLVSEILSGDPVAFYRMLKVRGAAAQDADWHASVRAEAERLRAEVEELKRSIDFRTAVAYDCGHSAAIRQAAPAGETADETRKHLRREDFCERYWRESDVPFERINALQGYVQHAGYILAAIPCDCQDEGCEGWQMQLFAISGETADERQAAIVAALRDKMGGRFVVSGTYAADWIASGEWRKEPRDG